MAAGSQKWNGTSADLLIAPTSTQRIAIPVRAVSSGVSVTSSWKEYEPPGTCPRMMMPPSMTSPPNVVTMIASIAARRETLRS